MFDGEIPAPSFDHHFGRMDLLRANKFELLSLAQFQPNRAQPPYLTSPRSLEACRRCGVRPIELVELNIDEFRKEFPNDPAAAQARYERVERARKQMLQEVMKEWNSLCGSSWQQNASKPKHNSEAILTVPEEAHCSLLEIQAQQFRKMEQDEWKW